MGASEIAHTTSTQLPVRAAAQVEHAATESVPVRLSKFALSWIILMVFQMPSGCSQKPVRQFNVGRDQAGVCAVSGISPIIARRIGFRTNSAKSPVATSMAMIKAKTGIQLSCCW